MTSDKHKAEDWLETAKNSQTHKAGIARAAYAQVHATLALVEAADAQVAATIAQTEQLRLGNIIAWTTANGYGLSDQTRDEIGRGLGL